MDYGRLIRAGRYRRDPHAVAYIVALADAAAAIDLIRNSVTGPGHEIEDIGRVSDALLQALHIRPGEFARADPPHLRSAPPLPAPMDDRGEQSGVLHRARSQRAGACVYLFRG